MPLFVICPINTLVPFSEFVSILIPGTVVIPVLAFDTGMLQIEEKFEELRTFMMDKPYTRHLITPFIAIENDMEEGEDPQVRGAGGGGVV